MSRENYLPHYLWLISEFTFPYLDTEEQYRYITVARRGRVGDDRWAILDGNFCYNRADDRWDYEIRPSEREDEWMAKTMFSLEEALPLAKKLAAGLKVFALTQITRMLALRVQRARESGDQNKMAEALKFQSDWEIERKVLEADE